MCTTSAANLYNLVYSDESSEPVYTEFASQRCNSLESINSMESSFEDDESVELKQFADKFVDNIFSE